MALWSTAPDMASAELWITCLLILVSGIIMIAGGAGGGGVFVAILVSVYNLTAHDAVPLSKFIIFLAAICTFLMNTVWSGKTKLIDFTLIRAIVPMSLAGTLIGVTINTYISDEVLMILLCILQISLLIKTSQLAYSRYKIEKASTPLESMKPAGLPNTFGEMSEEGKQGANIEGASAHSLFLLTESQKNWVLIILIPIVVGCGVGSRLAKSIFVDVILTMAPILICLAVTIFFRRIDETRNTITLGVTGLFSGITAGLFGVGGGFIVSPVLLHMGIDPVIAVAVASTGVLFASASTALQYLLVGRVMVLAGLLFSVFGIGSSVLASFLSGFIIKKTGKKYPISVLVVLAIATSAVLTLIKTIEIV